MKEQNSDAGNLAPEELDDDSLEIVVEQDEGDEEQQSNAGPTMADVVVRMQQLEEENRQLREMHKGSLDALGNAVTTMNRPQVQTQQQQQIPLFDEEKFKEEIDNNFLDSPKFALDKYFNQKILPAMQQVATIVGDKTEMSLQLLLTDKESAEYYTEYKAEVDEVIKNMPMEKKLKSLDVAKEALRIVKANHVDEIIAKQVAKATQTPPPLTTVSKTTATPGALGGGNTPPPKVGAKSTLKIRPEQMAADKAEADRQGVSLDYYQKWKYKGRK